MGHRIGNTLRNSLFVALWRIAEFTVYLRGRKTSLAERLDVGYEKLKVIPSLKSLGSWWFSFVKWKRLSKNMVFFPPRRR